MPDPVGHAGGMLGPSLDARFDGRPAELIDGWWWREVTGPGTVIPDGAVDVMWSARRSPWIAGPDTGPRPVELPAGVGVVGLRLRPGVAAALLRAGTDAATDRNVPLAEVVPRADAERLDEVLAGAGSRPAAAAALAEFVATRVGADWAPDPVVVEAISAIRCGRPLADLGIGDRQLRRRFTGTVGYGTAFYRRVVRLDRFSRRLDDNSDRSLAELAAECGYFDEAHLWRDCVALTARTPGEMRTRR